VTLAFKNFVFFKAIFHFNQTFQKIFSKQLAAHFGPKFICFTKLVPSYRYQTMQEHDPLRN
jgi:hypothetical protein